MRSFSEIKKNLKKNTSNFKLIKIALLGDSSTQFLNIALKGLAMDFELKLEIWEADFNQIERQVFDPTSELYKFDPEVIIVFKSAHKLLGKYNKLTPEQYHLLASNELGNIQNIYSFLTTNSKAKPIFYNYTEIDDAVFGSFANKIESSFLFQIRKLNYELALFAAKNTNLFLCDIASIQNQIGKHLFFHPSVYINSDMVLSMDVLPLIASKTLDIIRAFNGQFKKCVILDLDNTVWGGIIGDDGIENIQIGNLGIGKAFTEFQFWIKKLKNRGVIIAVCSKNTESIAQEPFVQHPEMVLRLDDIAVFTANWENKADNIRNIQKILNIGFDSMVFLDDNPVERSIVRENIPEICIPELPEDPAEYLEFLYSLNLFETISVSSEDAERTKLYQIESQRISLQEKFVNEDDFLKNLDMRSIVEHFNTFNIPRVAQLSQRSNQWNLRTVRFTENEIRSISLSDQYFGFAFSLEDKFGDNGLICVIILQKENDQTLFVDTWLMSCRVLKRGMESFVLNTIAQFAQDNGYDVLKGEYLPTAKNVIVKDHYAEMGFEEKGSSYMLTLTNFEPRKTFITKKK